MNIGHYFIPTTRFPALQKQTRAIAPRSLADRFIRFQSNHHLKAFGENGTVFFEDGADQPGTRIEFPSPKSLKEALAALLSIKEQDNAAIGIDQTTLEQYQQVFHLDQIQQSKKTFLQPLISQVIGYGSDALALDIGENKILKLCIRPHWERSWEASVDAPRIARPVTLPNNSQYYLQEKPLGEAAISEAHVQELFENIDKAGLLPCIRKDSPEALAHAKKQMGLFPQPDGSVAPRLLDPQAARSRKLGEIKPLSLEDRIQSLVAKLTVPYSTVSIYTYLFGSDKAKVDDTAHTILNRLKDQRLNIAELDMSQFSKPPSYETLFQTFVERMIEAQPSDSEKTELTAKLKHYLSTRKPLQEGKWGNQSQVEKDKKFLELLSYKINPQNLIFVIHHLDQIPKNSLSLKFYHLLIDISKTMDPPSLRVLITSTSDLADLEQRYKLYSPFHGYQKAPQAILQLD